MPGHLGRIPPKDWEHVEKYPLTAAHVAEITQPRPVVIGVNWYPEFDDPVKDSKGVWWLPEPAKASRPRGGHSVCLKPGYVTDQDFWWRLYDQGEEGICVAEAGSRLQTLNNRRTYQPRWLYDQCKKIDGIPSEEGTFVNAAFKVLKAKGHVRRRLGEPQGLTPHQFDKRTPVLADGISTYRWARSIDDVLEVLGFAGFDYVEVLNSWGTYFPHITRMRATTLERLWREDGEIGLSTDR